MKQETLMTLDELVAALARALPDMGLASLPDRRAAALPDARMIRYYTSLGLLDPPLIRERKAHYHQGHQEQVLLIKVLQAQGLSLQQIQQQYYGISAAERQALLQNFQPQVPVPEATLWREYQLIPGLRLQIADSFATELADIDQVAEKLTQLLKQLKRGA